MKRFAVSILGTLVVVLSLLALPSAAQATPFNGAGYYYAGGSQTFSGTDYVQGWGGNAYVAKPFIPNTPTGGVYDHAVTDLVVNETTSGIAGNAIEAGIAVNRNVWGDFNPHLFVCAWHNSVDNGCWTGGANWVDNGANAVDVGSDLSADIGTSKAIIIKYFATGCGAASTGWWVQYGTAQVGCFTPTAFGGSTWSTSKFVQAFGEYHYNGVNNPGTSNDKPCGDLGNGTAPGVGAAYISSVTLYGASPGTLTPSLTLFTPTDANAYDAAFTSGTTTRSFYYGGAGYKFVSGVATTPGNVGSC